ALDGHEIGATALVVHLDRFAPTFDAAAKNLDGIVVGEVALELDLPIFHVGDDRAKEKDLGFVLRFARGREIGLEARDELAHALILMARAPIFSNLGVHLPLLALAGLFVVALL